MTMPQARFIIVVVGIILPYLARLPGGSEWLGDTAASFSSSIFLGVLSLIFFGAFNAIAWGCLLALSFKYERPVALLIPCLIGFGFLAWAHGTLDLGADPQAAIALVVIPFYALVPIAIGGALGYVVDRILRRKAIT